MNIKQIKQQASNQITFERGVDYYENGHVQNYHMNVSKNITLDAQVIGSLNNIYQVRAEFNEYNELEEYNCQCQAFNTYKGCCKHIIALLLHYYYDIDHKPTHFGQSVTKTDRIAAKMITNYTNKSINEVVSDTSFQKVHLIPQLDIDYKGKLRMSFTIGHVRPYVLRSLSKFYHDMNEHNITEYGKNLTFYHDIKHFSEDSQALVKFVLNVYFESHYYQLESNYYRPRNDDRFLTISPSALDKFFEIYINKNINFSENGKQTQVTFVDTKPNITLSIKPVEDAFDLSINFKEALILNGESYQYILIDHLLYRLNENFTEKVGPLLQALREKGASLIISRQDMPTFCINVLNEIRNHITINADENILSEFEPTPLVSKLYIDLDEEHIVSAKLKFIYGDYEFDAFDERRGDIYRNVKEELIAKNMVKKYFEIEYKEKAQFQIYENEMIYHLYVEGIEELSKYMQIYVSDQFKSLVRKSPSIKIGVNVNHHLLDIDIDTSEFPMNELMDILQAYKRNKKYFRLKDGSFIHLEDNSLSELAQITDGLDLSIEDLENQNVTVPKYRALFLDNMLKNSEFIKSERDNYFKEIVRDVKDVDDTAFIIPDTLKDILRNYQKTGFRWLKTMSYYGFGGILADDMGLGKTIQIISLIQSYLNETPNSIPTLVVCPASLVLNWEVELNHFAPQIKVLTIIGSIDARKDIIKRIDQYEVILTSYDYLKRDIDLYIDKKFMFHIIDEAQYIKNHHTLNARSVKQIKSQCRFALTGTPIENNLAEIWSIFDFIMPGYLYSYRKFNQNYEIPIVKEENKKVLCNLKKLITPFVIRRLKKDVLKELPDKTETTMYAYLEGEQKKLYLANVALIKKEVNEKIQSGFNKNKLMILSMLTRLRQLCCDPSLYYDDYHGESAKLKMCLQLIDTSIESGHKILLFSQFTSMLAIIKNKLIEKGISFYLLEGATKKEERKRLVDHFNADDTNVFLISLKAGGTGLNLTSADVVIHYDPWWNISAQNQATDRTHRIGQKENVQVYKLIAKNTIEEKILKLQESKLRLADSIIVEDDGIITKMSEKDILELFD
ncbi:DEAD/DEAH box helicase [Mycoplasmatota bacterium]|nr:DEAD/DEAH box helicase [Mycoplasmatota bacterium]